MHSNLRVDRNPGAGFLKTCWLLVIASALFSCSGREGPHTSGETTIGYIGISNTDVSVRLVNNSARPINIRAEYTLTGEIKPWPGVTEIRCESALSDHQEEQPFPLADGVWKRVQISSGESLDLKISTTIPQRHKGSRCDLLLRLDDGKNIGPINFTP